MGAHLPASESEAVATASSAVTGRAADQGDHHDFVELGARRQADGTYQSAFLATPDGVVLFDAPPTIGHNLRRAVDEVRSAASASNWPGTGPTTRPTTSSSTSRTMTR